MADAVVFLDGHAAGGEPSVAHAAAHACTIGRRKGMEDALVVAGSFRGNPGEDLYAVFDGFAGSEVSAAASELFPGMLAAELDAADAVGAGQDVAGGNDDGSYFYSFFFFFFVLVATRTFQYHINLVDMEIHFCLRSFYAAVCLSETTGLLLLLSVPLSGD